MIGTTGDTTARPGTLKDHLEELAAALQALARAEGEEALKSAGETVRRLAGQASHLVDGLAGPAKTLEATAEDALAQLEEAIRKQPLAAVGIAAAAGVLLALLVRR